MERYKVVDKLDHNSVFAYTYKLENAEEWVQSFDSEYYDDKSLTKDRLQIIKVED